MYDDLDQPRGGNKKFKPANRKADKKYRRSKEAAEGSVKGGR